MANDVSGQGPSVETNVHSVVLTEYDPAWPVAFHREAIRLLEAAKGLLVDINHIGSTSIPGLAAKPTIDMLGEVDQTDLVSAPLRSLLEPLGYRDRSAEFTDRLLFSAGPLGSLTHNLHIVAKGAASSRNEILFRDRMRRDPEAASQYESLKRTLANRSYRDPHGYSRAKSAFVVTIIDEERATRGLPPVDIWATLGPVRQKVGWRSTVHHHQAGRSEQCDCRAPALDAGGAAACSSLPGHCGSMWVSWQVTVPYHHRESVHSGTPWVPLSPLPTESVASAPVDYSGGPASAPFVNLRTRRRCALLPSRSRSG
jgi:GrpB-like predicted nucleotidyltransferase (UPF0157 family)